MSETSELTELYSAIEESARLFDVPYSHDTVSPILTAYQDAIPNSSIAFRMGTGKRYSNDVDWRFTVPPGDVSPYDVALSHGLIESTGHPVFSLLPQVAERHDVNFYGVDFGVAGGLKKMYVAFPADGWLRLSTLLDLPSMPPSVADNLDFFTRHGMAGQQIPTLSIDYRHRTVNLYFNGLPTDKDSVRSIFQDLQLPQPSEQLTTLSERAIGAYATLGWESSKIERFSFSIVAENPADLPVPMEPEIEKFLTGIRHRAADDKFFYYAAASSTGEEIYKIQSYYRFKPWLNPMLESESAAPDSRDD
ncbi:aromatic prenyltransferase [Streptomyces venezuelae]|uniref:Prenyltransferase n=1 Tax=Streptomyces venezuelae TaxID=54571 RepID=A0A5P2BSR0_STRVZ|nr:aromatic prenyltransferase [Streptomyces venezuelae]QES32111.1 prenyltransferase [Streptomyces venezuelae]